MANNYTDSFEGNPYYIKKGEQLSAAGMNAALNTKEKVANKVITINSQSTDAQYPSAKMIYDTLSGTNNDIVHKASAETITGVKTFGTTTAAAEPLLGVAKTTAVTNTGTKFATEAQVYSLAQALAEALLPVGTILAMSVSSWTNAGATFQSKWRVCDGTGGTPNLSGRFLRGGTSTDAATGGADSRSFTIGTGNLPNHEHTFTGTTATGRLPIKGDFHHRDVSSYGRAPSGVFKEGSRDGWVVGLYNWYDEPDLNFSMTPQGSVTGGGKATPDQITINTVPNYYTVIYIMKIA
ncbi:MAG: hypothetical protein LBL50_03455 [Candidatus Margulisbacteria bacterium]|nr:hypothetical protein [Candidatus Margulisiibacteriota bacterium]